MSGLWSLSRNSGSTPTPGIRDLRYEQMLSYMVYSGMPSHYSHWSYGKSLEKLKTLYDYGLSGPPYEMVINSNPAIAYLMRDNTLSAAGPDDGACLRAQRFFQKQLYFQNHPRPDSLSRRSKPTQTACAIMSKTRASDWRKWNVFWTPRTRFPFSAGATLPSANKPKKSNRSKLEDSRPRMTRFNRSTAASEWISPIWQNSGCTGRRYPSFYSRPQPPARGMGKRPDHHSPRTSRSILFHRLKPRL